MCPDEFDRPVSRWVSMSQVWCLPVTAGLQNDADVQAMLQGSTVLKVRSPRWQKRRALKLLDDGVTVQYESKSAFSKSKPCKLRPGSTNLDGVCMFFLCRHGVCVCVCIL